jgi:hypothetical protein
LVKQRGWVEMARPAGQFAGSLCKASTGAGLAAYEHCYPQRGAQEAGVSFFVCGAWLGVLGLLVRQQSLLLCASA